MKKLELECRHCWANVVPVLSISGPHVKAECPNCSNYIKHLNSTERGVALACGMGVSKDGRNNRKRSHRKVYQSKRLKNDEVQGVW